MRHLWRGFNPLVLARLLLTLTLQALILAGGLAQFAWAAVVFRRPLMPLFSFRCKACNQPVRRLLDPEQPVPPCQCGGELERAENNVGAAVYETLDNGGIPKSVTRLVESERLLHERNNPTRTIS